MATQGQQVRETYVAGADLRERQFRFVTVGSGGKVTATTASAKSDGVLLNDPNEDEAATVAVFGRVIVEVGAGGITAGAEVASGANGVAVAAASTAIRLGRALETGVAGQLVTVDFYKGGNAA
jgi:hypothetical protein